MSAYPGGIDFSAMQNDDLAEFKRKQAEAQTEGLNTPQTYGTDRINQLAALMKYYNAKSAQAGINPRADQFSSIGAPFLQRLLANQDADSAISGLRNNPMPNFFGSAGQPSQMSGYVQPNYSSGQNPYYNNNSNILSKMMGR